jgi:predicted phosphoribosyltransferase
MVFRDRRDAGRYLAAKLAHYRGVGGVIVVGLPRGGVPVAYEVARALDAPLDVFIVRKLGLPGHEELAMGAIATGGVQVLNEVAERLHVPAELVDRVARQERRELERQQSRYRQDRPPLDVRGGTVILVDDGLATGSTMLAAVEALRRQQPRRIVAAVPVGAPESCSELAAAADDVVCACQPRGFKSVGAWYDDFAPISDEEVEKWLADVDRRARILYH